MRYAFSLLMVSPVFLMADCAFKEPAAAAPTAGMQPGYNAPFHVDIQKASPNVWNVSAAFIYWQASQDNMELGVVGDTTDVHDAMNGKFVNLDEQYKPGFKVGAGVTFNPDNWDFNAEYTRFHGTQHVSKTLDSSNALIGLYPAWDIPSSVNSHYFHGNESWKLHMDIVDAEMGRSFYVGKKLVYRPFMGLRAPWILQKLNATYSQDVTDLGRTTTVAQTSHSWGIGPRVGLGMDWKLGKDFCLYGVAGADVVYTQYTKFSLKQESSVLGVVSDRGRYTYSQTDVNTLRAHTDLTLGLGWGMFFANNKARVKLSADYGFQIFFNQNMFRNFVDDQALAKSFSPNGNLYIQGLTVNLGFDF